MQISIEWKEAIQESNAIQKERIKQETEYRKNLETAKDEVWEHLANAPLSCNDFEDYALMNGVEIDDLFNEFI